MLKTRKESVIKKIILWISPAAREVERRRMERIRIVLTMMCQRQDGHDDEFRMITDNINLYGIKFLSPRKLRVEEILKLKILLVTCHRNIEVPGRVVWFAERMVNGQTCFEGGIEFIGLKKDDRVLLESFIERHRINDLYSRFSNSARTRIMH